MAAGPRRVGRRDLLGASALGITSTLLPPATAAASNGGLAGTGSADELDASTVEIRALTGAPDGATEGIRGLATDGTHVYWRRQSGVIRQVTMAGAWVADRTVTGVPDLDPNNELAVSSGFLFLRGVDGDAGTLTAVSLTDWSVRSVTVPSGREALTGPSYIVGNLLDLPDGRLGTLAGPQETSAGVFDSTLRTWSVDTSSDPVTLTFDRDYVLRDTTAWPGDCHGIASDGVHLYRLGFSVVSPGVHSVGYRTWQLSADGPSSIVNDASGTNIDPVPNWNATYMARDHRTGDYLVGDFHGGNGGPFLVSGGPAT